MAEFSPIEWCDSTHNLQMGCNGCELWIPKKGFKRCYAGLMTERKVTQGPMKGWPVRFEEPTIFPERMKDLRRWKDLTGTTRPDKPWLDGYPRIIFWNDMGDAFTEGLPLDWLAPYLDEIARMPHIHMWLTKRPERMAEFFAKYPCPNNVWPGTSVTGPSNVNRVKELTGIKSDHLWVSYEPAWEYVDLEPWLADHRECTCYEVIGGAHQMGCMFYGEGRKWLDQIPNILSLVIVGGASGPDAEPFDVEIAERVIEVGKKYSTAVFVKQLGTHPYDRRESDRSSDSPHPQGPAYDPSCRLNLVDRKGGDWNEWAERLRVRQLPLPLAA